MINSKTAFYVLLYIGAIVPANLLVTWLGPRATIPTAFLFIGLALTSRDHLHEVWRGRRLFLKMTALVFAGSLLSWLINRRAGPVAAASLTAFAAAGAVDAFTYHFLHRYSRWIKVNGSNILSAAADSVIFPTVAFGTLLPWIILGQFAAKVLGGFIWMLLLDGRRKTVGSFRNRRHGRA